MDLSLLLFLLLLTTATSAASRDTAAATAAAITPTNSSTSDEDDYICYLCSGRNPMMLAWCPIELDSCRLVCYDPNTAAALSPARSPVSVSGLGRRGGGGGNSDDCYVMKLYADGSYVVVATVSCSSSAGCALVCTNDREFRNATGAATGRTPRGGEFQRCGDQLIAPSASALPPM